LIIKQGTLVAPTRTLVKIPGDEAIKVKMDRTIIFSNKKYMCEQLLNTLWDQNGLVTIHGDKTQQERDRAL